MTRVDPTMPSILIWVLFGRCTGTDPMHIRGIGRVYIRPRKVDPVLAVGVSSSKPNNLRKRTKHTLKKTHKPKEFIWSF
jgi:hypothetical protein